MLPPYPTAPEVARGWRTEKARQRELAVRMEGVMASRTGSRRRADLSAHKEEIQRWVEEGYADSQMASWLGTSATSVQSFRSRHQIGRRSGGSSRGRRSRAEVAGEVFEGVLDHPRPTRRGKRRPKGIWFDPTIADTQRWQSHWSGVREVRVRIGPSSIIIEAQEKGEGS